MRAHNVIIVSSGRTNYVTGQALDELIRSIVALNKKPILVLGPDGDDLMRVCTEIESCEIVFDPNYEGEMFSSVKAGLFAINGASFVLPLAENTLETAKWMELEKQLMVPTNDNVLRPVTPSSDAAYPQLVTARGVRELRDLPATTAWADADAIGARTIDI